MHRVFVHAEVGLVERAGAFDARDMQMQVIQSRHGAMLRRRDVAGDNVTSTGLVRRLNASSRPTESSRVGIAMRNVGRTMGRWMIVVAVASSGIARSWADEEPGAVH